MEFTVYTDGGARGNPGPAGIGFVVHQGQKTIHTAQAYIGETTNNMAEYGAVIAALKWLRTQSAAVTAIAFFLDSELVVKQLNGIYKVKHPQMRENLLTIRNLEGQIKADVSYAYIPRAQNQKADMLVNLALDEHEAQHHPN